MTMTIANNLLDQDFVDVACECIADHHDRVLVVSPRCELHAHLIGEQPPEDEEFIPETYRDLIAFAYDETDYRERV